jgi:hypothetical protein
MPTQITHTTNHVKNNYLIRMPTTFPVSPKSLKEKSTTYLNPKAKTCLHLSNVGFPINHTTVNSVWLDEKWGASPLYRERPPVAELLQEGNGQGIGITVWVGQIFYFFVQLLVDDLSGFGQFFLDGLKVFPEGFIHLSLDQITMGLCVTLDIYAASGHFFDQVPTLGGYKIRVGKKR